MFEIGSLSLLPGPGVKELSPFQGSEFLIEVLIGESHE